MKATAKHDCNVMLTTSLHSLSTKHAAITKGQVIELPVEDIRTFNPSAMEYKHLGDKRVAFRQGDSLMITYAKDFDYED